ncbi:MAG TPA: alpha-galactosidase [Candidatus Hydrogenedentes bacterium]|nr:alpha-galactosidase [Candidatus Hydrogenedentota bacterium]
MAFLRCFAFSALIIAATPSANAENSVPFPVPHSRLATDAEMAEARAWLERWFDSAEPRPPFSFTYGGAGSPELLADWRLEHTQEILEGRQVRRLVWSNAAGFQVHCEAVSYANYPAIDWLVSFQNAGSADTPILENVRALDVSVPIGAGAAAVIHHARGSDCAYTDFAPLADTLAPGGSLALNSHGRGGDRGGLPSVEAMPFFNVETADSGILFALGWSAPWEARFEQTAPNELALQAGTEPIRAKLMPGEHIRTARIVMLFWQEGRLRAHNLWRRLLLDYYSPTPGGKPFTGLLADANWGSWMNAERHLEEIAWWNGHNLPMECYWVDAGWTDMSQGWEAHQSHQTPNKDLFPNGMKPLAEAAHSRGMKFLLWMVPGSVHPAVGIGKERPEWLGEPFTHKDYGGMVFYGLDHGKPDVNNWMIAHFSQVVDDFGVDVFRQDGGNLWPEDKDPDRQGMNRTKYIEGFYDFWDALLGRHPGLLIDNCAEGGRKIDIETIRRSIVLWRSDCQASGDFDPVSNQGFNYGLFHWLPLCGGAAPVSSLNPYAFRSAYCPAMLVGWPMTPVANLAGRWSTIDIDLLRKLLQEYVSVRPYLFGDFYPLTPYSIEHAQWVAWQFDRPDIGEGMLQAFRRPECKDETQTYPLHGLDPNDRYRLIDRDTAATVTLTGAELMSGGAPVSIPGAPGAALLTYRKEG